MIHHLSLLRTIPSRLTTSPLATVTPTLQSRRHACQIHHPTKLGQLRAKLRAFGGGHIELDIHHSTGLALLTLHNPEKQNALTGKMMAELADCVDLLEELTTVSSSGSSYSSSSSYLSEEGAPSQEQQTRRTLPSLNPESKLLLKTAGSPITKLDIEHSEILEGLVGIIVTGAEKKSYCAGLDLSAAKSTLLTPQAGSEMSALMVSTLSRFMRLPILSVAAIEKAAIGGGAEMTTFCDHRVLAENAKVQFVQTVMGVVPGWGGASRLLGIVPRSNALRLLGGAVPIRGGLKAQQIGFSQLTASPGNAVEMATKYMQPYVWDRPPSSREDLSDGARRCVPAVRAMKQIVSFGIDDERIERVSGLEKDLFKQLWGGPDNLARVAAASSKKNK
ncbi:enoyl CoA hydratase domain-containing protein 1 [Podila humilis]|nr:enoyl CoA hydratase domain-containing protein 1 [Podila humilis]